MFITLCVLICTCIVFYFNLILSFLILGETCSLHAHASHKFVHTTSSRHWEFLKTLYACLSPSDQTICEGVLDFFTFNTSLKVSTCNFFNIFMGNPQSLTYLFINRFLYCFRPFWRSYCLFWLKYLIFFFFVHISFLLSWNYKLSLPQDETLKEDICLFYVYK